MVEVGQWGPEPFLDRSGRPLTSLTLTVYETDGTTLADLYTSQAGDTALANPLPIGVATTAAGLDVRGNGNFYAAPGSYVIAAIYLGNEVYRSRITVGVDVESTGDVSSVNGQTGVVVLESDDIDVTGTGGLNITEVVDALAGVITDHVGNPLGAHAATAISANSATLVGTGASVQAVLEELDDAIVAEASARATADGLLIPLTQKAAANGVATLGADSLIPTNQLPPIALSEFKGLVASEVAMTALTAEIGDYCIRTDFDPDQWFLLTAAPAATAANWLTITANQVVDSVNGQVGVVVLTKTDVGLGNVDNTSDANKPVSTATQTALDLKQDISTLWPLDHTGTTAATDAITLDVTGDSQLRFTVNQDGSIYWGPGNAIQDIAISRGAAQTLRIAPPTGSGLTQAVIELAASEPLSRWAYIRAFDAFGDFSISGWDVSQTIKLVGQVRANPNSAAVIPLVARGAAAQSANLQEWQTSTPTTVASISPAGYFTSNGILMTASAALQDVSTNGAYLTFENNAAAKFIGRQAAAQVLFVRGVISQTADLQQWQDSTQAVLAKVKANGDIEVPDEAYGAGWNASVEVPTKNALYDKIETLGSSGLTHPQVMSRISIGI